MDARLSHHLTYDHKPGGDWNLAYTAERNNLIYRHTYTSDGFTSTEDFTIYQQLAQLLPKLENQMVEALWKFQMEMQMRDGWNLDAYLNGYLFWNSFIDQAREEHQDQAT